MFDDEDFFNTPYRKRLPDHLFDFARRHPYWTVGLILFFIFGAPTGCGVLIGHLLP
jgi:hypothetical protein